MDMLSNIIISNSGKYENHLFIINLVIKKSFIKKDINRSQLLRIGGQESCLDLKYFFQQQDLRSVVVLNVYQTQSLHVL